MRSSIQRWMSDSFQPIAAAVMHTAGGNRPFRMSRHRVVRLKPVRSDSVPECDQVRLEQLARRVLFPEFVAWAASRFGRSLISSHRCVR